MANPFKSVRFHAMEKSKAEVDALTSGAAPVVRGFREATEPKGPAETDEAAARFYLSRVLGQSTSAVVRGLSASESPDVVPDMRLRDSNDRPQSKTRLLRFEQTHESVPIFGSNAVVELGQNRKFVSASAEVTQVGDVDPTPTISEAAALRKVSELNGVDLSDYRPGNREDKVVYYHDDDRDEWHLAFFFREVPAAPAEFLRAAGERTGHGHGGGPSPYERFPLFNYLVDAHDGKVLQYYSATPMLKKCRGLDEMGVREALLHAKDRR